MCHDHPQPGLHLSAVAAPQFVLEEPEYLGHLGCGSPTPLDSVERTTILTRWKMTPAGHWSKSNILLLNFLQRGQLIRDYLQPQSYTKRHNAIKSTMWGAGLIIDLIYITRYYEIKINSLEFIVLIESIELDTLHIGYLIDKY